MSHDGLLYSLINKTCLIKNGLRNPKSKLRHDFFIDGIGDRIGKHNGGNHGILSFGYHGMCHYRCFFSNMNRIRIQTNGCSNRTDRMIDLDAIHPPYHSAMFPMGGHNSGCTLEAEQK